MMMDKAIRRKMTSRAQRDLNLIEEKENFALPTLLSLGFFGRPFGFEISNAFWSLFPSASGNSNNVCVGEETDFLCSIFEGGWMDGWMEEEDIFFYWIFYLFFFM